jgi:hypothetical protein
MIFPCGQAKAYNKIIKLEKKGPVKVYFLPVVPMMGSCFSKSSSYEAELALESINEVIVVTMMRQLGMCSLSEKCRHMFFECKFARAA